MIPFWGVKKNESVGFNPFDTPKETCYKDVFGFGGSFNVQYEKQA